MITRIFSGIRLGGLNVLSTVPSFIITVFISTYYSIDIYGQFGYLNRSAQIFILISLFGVDKLALYENNSDRVNTIILFLLKTLIPLCIVLTYVSYALNLEFLFYISVLVFGFLILKFFSVWLITRKDFFNSILAEKFVPNILFLFLLITIRVFDISMDLNYLIIIYALSRIIVIFIYSKYLRQRFRVVSKKLDLYNPYIWTNIIGIIRINYDVILLSLIAVTSIQQGYLMIALQISGLVLLFQQGLSFGLVEAYRGIIGSDDIQNSFSVKSSLKRMEVLLLVLLMSLLSALLIINSIQNPIHGIPIEAIKILIGVLAAALVRLVSSVYFDIISLLQKARIDNILTSVYLILGVALYYLLNAKLDAIDALLLTLIMINLISMFTRRSLLQYGLKG